MIDITNEFTSNVAGCSVNKAFFKAGIVYAYFDVKDVTGKAMFTVKNPKYYPKIHWRQVVDRVSTLGILLADSGGADINYYSESNSGNMGGAYVSYLVV